MSYRLEINGVEIRCDTVAEALALAKHAAASSRIDRTCAEKGGRSAAHAESATNKRRVEQAQRSLRFLVAVRDAGDKGIGGKQLVRAVKCNGPSGLGTVSQMTQRFLHEAGIDLEHTAKRRRNGDEKLWFAGPQIQQGIRALEELTSNE